MMKFVLFALLVNAECSAQSTKRENVLLSRKKRYLTFPAGSNFVMTASVIKALLIKAPRATMLLGEMDVPFSLPSDTRIFRNYRRPHGRQRREIFNQLTVALDGFGLNGGACIRRMMCESEQYIPTMEDSFVKEILSTIFKDFEDFDPEYSESCSYNDCDVSFLNHLDELLNTAT